MHKLLYHALLKSTKYKNTLYLLLAVMLSLLTQNASASSFWHCGGDEDGCTQGSCLCIPQDMKQQPYCVNFDDNTNPCAPATSKEIQKNQCDGGSSISPSQEKCLKMYFDDNHCSIKSPYACSMICNKNAGACHATK